MSVLSRGLFFHFRPLPEDAMKYAREDTHYLLYIYANMSNQLLKKANGKTNLLESVYSRTTDICKKVKDDLFLGFW